jgi:cysteinyl-tRNA synthetase
MKKIAFLLLIVFILSSLVSCPKPRDYRQDMREFVQRLSAYANALVLDFLIVPQNGGELITQNGEENGPPAETYIAALDGVGREDLYYGYEQDNQPTPASETSCMEAFLDIAEAYNVDVLVTDYCWTQVYVDDSYSRSALKGYISFAADFRELHHIPDYPLNPYSLNPNDIFSLHDAKNFLYLINTALYSDKLLFLNDLQATNYDLLIIDLFFDGNEIFPPSDIESLKIKNSGGRRLVLAYLSLGEAEDYRYYWNKNWIKDPPSWLGEENPEWEGNYKVRYWKKEWQDIIFGNDDSYLKKIIDAGFDGVYLDLIDAFEFWEEKNRLSDSVLSRLINRQD